MAEENTPKDSEQQETSPSAGQAPTEQQADAQAEAKSTEKEPAAKAKPATSAGDQAEKKPPKKEKPPAVEDKPFQDFIRQDFLPALTSALRAQGLEDLDLEFERRKFDVIGFEQSPLYWHVIGQWQQGRRQFRLAFLKDDISGPKVFSYSDSGSKPSTLESFMVDERKVTLDLMIHYMVQRLNAQKWLVRN